MRKKVIFITGPHGVGKTYTTDFLKSEMDILHLDLGPIIRAAHKKIAPNLSLGQWISSGERQFGKNYSDMVLCREMQKLIQNSSSPIVLITGSRSVEGMQFIVDYFSVKKPTVIFMDAPVSLLKANYEHREHLTLSKDDFEEILGEERKMGLPGLKRYVAENNQHCHFIINKDNSYSIIEKIKNIVLGAKVSTLAKSKIELLKGEKTYE